MRNPVESIATIVILLIVLLMFVIGGKNKPSQKED